MNESEFNSSIIAKVLNQKNLLVRILAALTRPSLLLSIAYFDESIAGIIGFYFIVSSILTSSLSFSYYKEYMPNAVNIGLISVRTRILKHTSFATFLILFISFLLDLNPWIPCSFIFEFYLHQTARVHLYRKEFWYWCIKSVLIPFLFILFYFIFINSSQSFILYFYLCSIPFFGLSLFLSKPFQMLKDFYRHNIFFGLSRKLLVQLDKLIIGFMIDPSIFWIFAIMYQISNAGILLFDTLMVMPNKNKIVKNTFKYKKNIFNRINYIISFFSLSILITLTMLLVNENYIFYIVLCVLLVQRIFFLNKMNLSLEIYFWKFNLTKITIIISILIVVISITSYLVLNFVSPKEIGTLFITILFSFALYIITIYINKQLKYLK